MRLPTPNIICLASLLALGALSCKKGNIPDSPAVTKTLQLPAGSDAVIAAGNQFAFKFFNTVLQQDPALNNKLVSPLSIYTALSMVYNGAAGATRDSIAKTLQLNGISIDQLNALNKALIEQMPTEDSKVAMNIANSIWYKQGGPQPLPSFLNTVQKNYEAQVQSLDFSSPSAVNTINSWVAEKTKNKIPKVINSITTEELMFLINTIYFNGGWMKAFKPNLTHNANFDRPTGGNVSVPFMSGEKTVLVRFDPSFTIVELPYGGGKSYDMYLVLPTNKTQSIIDFAASFDAGKMTNALSKLDSLTIQINLPKWEYSYSIDNMKPHLTQLGMGDAFEDADLSNMYPPAGGQYYISRAIHKTNIKVSEQGTEAAAATVISIGLTSAGPSNPPVVTFDHPFLYILREKQAGTVLFIGLVTDPSQS